MDKIGAALIAILAIDLFLFLGQMAMFDINPAAQQFWGTNGSFMTSSDFNTGDYAFNASTAALDPLTADEDVTSGESSIWDNLNVFLLIKNWIKSTKGYQYAVTIIASPYFFMVAVHAPPALCFGVGVFWAVITIILFIALITGREL